MENIFSIGIPTLNRADLLIPALYLYFKEFPNTKIYVVDNGNQEELNSLSHPNLTIIKSEKNIGVAASWNLMCRLIFKDSEYALIMNDDIYFGKSEEQINTLLKTNKKHFYCSPMDWCIFAISKQTWDKVGEFDEVFYPAYFEDNDYSHRMKLKAFKIHHIAQFLPSIHRASMTMEKDESILRMFNKNKKRYIEKWGGEPMREKYKIPYDGKTP